ncbi:7404_t:CDS:1, partial [Cetraspora pellucida]
VNKMNVDKVNKIYIECEGFGFRIEKQPSVTRIYLKNEIIEYLCRYETETEFNKYLEPDRGRNCFQLTKATTKCEIIDRNSGTTLVKINLT